MKDLSFFMREPTQDTITVQGPSSIKDQEGNPINIEIRTLSNSEIQKIHDSYKTRSVAYDRKGNPMVSNGEVVFKTEKDAAKTARHMIVEALVYPDLKDKKLMEFYNCYDVADMPFHVFPSSAEFAHVSKAVMSVLGFGSSEQDDELENAKN